MHEKSDLLLAHTRYVTHYESKGLTDLADREKKMVGGMLKRSLAGETDDADLLNNLAWFCATADLFLNEALQAAERAVALEPDAAYMLDTLAEVQFRLGMIDEAIITGERAMELDPESTYYKEQLDRFKAARED
jgi:tetratricopeptide (TPR) repeat protein